MAGVLNFNGNIVQTSTAQFSMLGGAGAVASVVTTEPPAEWTVRNPGTYSKLQAHVSANASTGVVLRVRVNQGNGSGILSIGTGTGYFEDTSGQDAVVAGDEVDLGYVAGNTSSVTLKVVGLLLSSTGGYSTRVGNWTAGGAAASITAAATSNFQDFIQGLQIGSAELNHVVESSCTFKNLFSYVVTNARTTTTDFRSRKNTADGNLLIQYTSGQTGVKEDTSNSDSLVAGDLIAFVIRTAAADTNAMTLHNISADLFDATTIPYVGTPNNSVLANTTTYIAIGGRQTSRETTEAHHQLKAEQAGKLKFAGVNVTTNTVTATSTLKTRVNGNPGNITLTIGSGVTGVISDLSNEDVVVSGDLINWQMATGATGTNMVYRSCVGFTPYPVRDIIQMGIIPFERA